MFTNKANEIFKEVINCYHIKDSVYQPFTNKYNKNSNLIEHLLYKKCWIDTVQWHYEDIIRDPNIEPVAALDLKRKIDASNQDRTDMVEYIDAYFLEKYKGIATKHNATINTESPAWGIDRLSILALKVYHMNEEAKRNDASKAHKTREDQAMVFGKVVIRGNPVELLVKCHKIALFRGCDTIAIK